MNELKDLMEKLSEMKKQAIKEANDCPLKVAEVSEELKDLLVVYTDNEMQLRSERDKYLGKLCHEMKLFLDIKDSHFNAFKKLEILKKKLENCESFDDCDDEDDEE